MGEAEVVFDQTTLSRSLKAGERTTVLEYAFVNRGSEEVRIVRFTGPCNCMRGELVEGKVVSGGRGTIRVTFTGNTWSNGQLTRNLLAHFNNGQNINLSARLDMTSPATVEPWSLTWRGEKEKKELKRIDIRFPPDAEAEVAALEPEGEDFDLKLEVVENKRYYRILAVPVATSPEQGVHVVRVKTTSRWIPNGAFNVYLVWRNGE